jgi:hypothetical protein
VSGSEAIRHDRPAGAAPGEERPTLRLDPETVEEVATRVAELLAARFQPPQAPHRRLLSAAEVSEWWGVERSWVYEHARELGAIRLGKGRRPRLRFDSDLVAQRIAALAEERRPAPQGRRRGGRRSRRIPADAADLLPLRSDPELRSSTASRGRPGGAGTPPAAAPKSKPSTR